jgi:hypothetical protein
VVRDRDPREEGEQRSGCWSVGLWVSACLAVLICCLGELGAAQDWAATVKPIGAYVTDCAKEGGSRSYLCDYHWSAGPVRFAGRLAGGPWPDGHPVRLWSDPGDPTHIDAAKSVLIPVVWFAVFGLGLLAVALGLLLRTVRPPGSPVRPLVALAVATGAFAVAALPAGAILVQASRVPAVHVPALAAPVVRTPRAQALVVNDPGVGQSESCPDMLEGSDHGGAVAVNADDYDGTVWLWDAAETHQVAAIIGYGGVPTAALSPDGRTLAVAGETVQLWDVATLRVTATLAGSYDAYRVAFSPDGTTISVCDGGSRILRWRL